MPRLPASRLLLNVLELMRESRRMRRVFECGRG